MLSPTFAQLPECADVFQSALNLKSSDLSLEGIISCELENLHVQLHQVCLLTQIFHLWLNICPTSGAECLSSPDMSGVMECQTSQPYPPTCTFAPKTPCECKQLLCCPSTSLMIQVHLFSINPNVESVPDLASSDLLNFLLNGPEIMQLTFPTAGMQCTVLESAPLVLNYSPLLHLLPVASFTDVIFSSA